MPPTAGANNATETSLSGIGFTPDANEEETSPAGAAEETEESASTETSEETESTESLDTAEEESGETAEDSEETPEESATEETEEEPNSYDALLPNRQLKSYPDELYALAAKKFGLDPALLQDPKQGKALRDLVKGKIDSDIDNRNMRDRLADFDTEEEEGTEEGDETAETTEGRQPIPPAKQYESILKFLDEGPDGQTPIVTDEGAKIYAEASLDAYTQLQEAMDKGDAKAIAAAQKNYTRSQAAFATALFGSVLPHLLPTLIRRMPTEVFRDMVGSQLEERDQMREVHKTARSELAKDPRYRDIDRMVKDGSLYRFANENPEMFDKVFKDANGNPIKDPLRLEMARYRYAIAQIRGANYRPPADYVKKGAEAGRRQAAEMEARRKASRGLGGGRTRGTLGTDGDKYSTDEWVTRMKKAGADSDPLGNFLSNVKP